MKVAIELKPADFNQGVDIAALVDNIDAEVQKFSSELGAESSQKKTPAPAGAQGDFGLVEWIIDAITDPDLARTYGTTLVFAINQLLNAVGKKDQQPKEAKEEQDDEPTEEPPAKIKMFGKEIALPATTHVIKKFLESLGE
ncbi:MAG: hypothetical protein AAFX06_14135 [Planctomycetota bacterium]